MSLDIPQLLLTEWMHHFFLDNLQRIPSNNDLHALYTINMCIDIVNYAYIHTYVNMYISSYVCMHHIIIMHCMHACMQCIICMHALNMYACMHNYALHA